MTCRWIVTVAMFLSTAASAQPDPQAIDDAIKTAVTSGKPLIVEMYTTWCGPCKKFASDTLPDAGVQTALQEVTFVRYDAEQAPGDAVAARYHVSGYPSFLALDSNGVEVARTSGLLDPKSFIAWLDSARAAMQTEAQVVADVLAKPSVETHLAAAKWYERRKRVGEAMAHHKWIAKSRAATPEQRKTAIRVGAKLQRLAAWRSDLIAEKVAAIRESPREATIDDLAMVAVDSPLSQKVVREICAAFLGARTFRTNLNNGIYVALTAGATEEALAAAKRLVVERRSATFLDTLAECHHLRGERVQALAIADEVRALLTPESPLWKAYEANRTRYEKGSGEPRELLAIRNGVDRFWENLAKVGTIGLDRVLEPSSQRVDAKTWRAAFEAQRKVEGDVTAGCLRTLAVKARVHAYVNIDGTNRLTLTSLLSETPLAPSVRRCIRHELAVGTMPYEPGEQLLTFGLRR